MIYRSRILNAVCLSLVLSGACLAQTTAPATSAPESASAKAPTTFLPDQATRPGPITMDLDPVTGFPPGGPPYSLFSPFEVYVRPFAAVVEGNGALSKVLNGGAGADVGVHSFYYNDDHSAAWYGGLGLGYQYNRGSDPSENVIVRVGQTTVTRFGSPVQLDSTTSLGVRELHRTTARIDFGREYYWNSKWIECLRYSWGADVGGVWGSASIKTDVNNRVIPDLQANDVIAYNPQDGHSSQVTKGFFLGTSFNMIFPHHTYDFVVGTRLEWQREYFNQLVDNNDGSGQLKLMLGFGWRY